MLRATVKNSFLALELEEEAEERRRVLGAARARSAGPGRGAAPAERPGRELGEASLERINDLLNDGLDQDLSAGKEARPSAAERGEAAKPSTAFQLTCTGGKAIETENSGTPSIDELRRLQRRLSEVTGVAGVASNMPSLKPVHQRAMSSSSLSTMVSDCEEPRQSPMLKVWSSGSVSTLSSELWEDHEEGGTEFGPIFEEDFPADQRAAQQECGLSKDEALQACAVTSTMDFSHSRVPKSLNLAEEFSKCSNEAPPTTMMIRNIPNRYSQRELIRELESLGFEGKFDFLYVPIDKATMCNVGYAFVNFTKSCWAAACAKTFENYSFKKHRKARGKIASVSVAHIQGLEANVRHYEHAAVNGTARSSRQRGPVIMARIASSLPVP